MNLENKNELGTNDITNGTEKKFLKDVWIVIGEKKVWPRKCSCGNIVYHKNVNRFYISRKWNKKCAKCKQKGSNNSFYEHKHTAKTKELLSRQFRGELNPMFGIGGMLGKKHNNETLQKQSVARIRYWKLKGHNPTKFEKYRNKVDSITRKQSIHLLENYEKRGKSGKQGAYHLDHIMPVWYGYHNNISPEKISNITNLKFIPWEENQRKWFYYE